MDRRAVCVMVLFGGILFFAAGCATTGHRSALPKQAATTRKRVVVIPRPAAPVRPAWVAKNLDYWIQDRQIMVREFAVDRNKSAALKRAESMARVRLAKNVKDLMLAEFQREVSVRKADAKTCETLASSFDSIAGKTKIEGIRMADYYIEKAGGSEKRGDDAYRVYVLMKISMTDYDKCLRQTLAALRENVAGSRRERRLVDAVNAGLPDSLL